MGRRAKTPPAELAQRLLAVKVMISDMKDAMPTAARELRRNASETIEDVVAELQRC